jgi:hypothetical protein
LKTSVVGNVRYNKRTIEADHTTGDGKRLAKWETERTISDPAEHEAAAKARGKARNIISRVCAVSAFGLLCPETAVNDLDKALVEAREITEAFNATAKLTRLSVYVITGRIAPDDVEAVRAISSELADLIRDMEAGISNLDVKAVRDAANKAKGVAAMLTPDMAAKVQMAVDAARGAARKIVQAGETVAAEIDKRTLATLAEARTAFLDLDEIKAVAVPEAEGRAVDFGPGITAKQKADEDRLIDVVDGQGWRV